MIVPAAVASAYIASRIREMDNCKGTKITSYQPTQRNQKIEIRKLSLSIKEELELIQYLEHYKRL